MRHARTAVRVTDTGGGAKPHARDSLEASMSTQQIDSTRSRARFTVHPYLHSAMTGTFASPTGSVTKLTNGRWHMDFSLQAASVAFPDSRRITGLTRSEAFFDATGHPIVRFTSIPFSASLLRDGGTLSGVLDLHGVSKPARFVVAKADCHQPGVTCPILAAGTISRSAFGMTRYKLVVGDNVDIAVDVCLPKSR
jgi:polyisoprenoid-binding protein YceI